VDLISSAIRLVRTSISASWKWSVLNLAPTTSSSSMTSPSNMRSSRSGFSPGRAGVLVRVGQRPAVRPLFRAAQLAPSCSLETGDWKRSASELNRFTGAAVVVIDVDGHVRVPVHSDMATKAADLSGSTGRPHAMLFQCGHRVVQEPRTRPRR